METGQLLNNFNTNVNDLLAPLNTPVPSYLLKLFIVLYAALAAPQLPDPVLDLFEHPVFRIVVMALVIWTSSRDPATSLIVATGLVVLFNTLSGRKPFETFLVEQNTNIMPSCLGVTMNDLVNTFQGDEKALRLALNNVGVPANVKLTDYDAPLLASYLVNYGYEINNKCKPPGSA